MSKRSVLILALALAPGLGPASSPLAAEPADGKGKDEAAGRLAFMERSIEPYRFRRGGDGGSIFKLQAEPAFRLGKQYTDVLEGAIFFWVGEGGRPEAAVQVFKVQNEGAPQGLWIHEFTSLSREKFVAEIGGRPAWSPGVPGVDFIELADSPRPAASASQRARQMRAMAQEFRASDNFGKKGWSELRLLPTPIARFGKPGTSLHDGAVFAFVEGTDPEVFLFLEAWEGKDGPRWMYGFAPMTVFAVKATRLGKAVWELPDRMPAKDPSGTFYDRHDEPQGRP